MAVRKLKRKNKTSRSWYVTFYDHNRKEHQVCAGTDKGSALSLDANLKRLVSARKNGQDCPELHKWIDQIPDQLRSKLVKWDIVTGIKATSKSLQEHLEDWHELLKASGITPKQADQLFNRVDRIFHEAGFLQFKDIQASKLTIALSGLQKTIRRKNKTTGKMEAVPCGLASEFTRKHFLKACIQFCIWMVSDGRVSKNPLEGQSMRATVQDPSRALTLDEVQYLLDYTGTADPVFGVSGQERSLIYQFAIETGLRRDEIASLKRPSFDFETFCVKVDPRVTKNRKKATEPIRETTAGLIREHLKTKTPDASAFRIPNCNTSRMIQRDLEDARRQWIDSAKDNSAEHRRRAESDFLKVETAEGKIVFHSLRHTFSTLLALSGVHPKVAQKLMRHSDPRLTMNIYTHLPSDQERAGVNALPDLRKQPAVMTGTDPFCVDAVGSQQIGDGKRHAYITHPSASNCGKLHKTAQNGGGVLNAIGENQNAKNALEGQETHVSEQNSNHVWRDSNPQHSVPKTDALSN